MATSNTTVTIKKTPRAKRPRIHPPIGKESRTKQSFKDECDINHILNLYLQKGTLPHINLKQPQYGVVPSGDFRDAMEAVTNAQATFDGLKAETRLRFNHDPGQFFDFALNPENEQELRDMGLLDPKDEPTPAPVADQPPAPAPVTDAPTEG